MNPHEQGPWKIERTEHRVAIYAHKCSCRDCRGEGLPWPMASYSRGRVFVPPCGVPLEPLRLLLRAVEAREASDSSAVPEGNDEINTWNPVW